MAVINFPPSDGDLMQSLWVKAWIWLGVLALCTAGSRTRVWHVDDRAIRLLLFLAAGAVTANIFIDYVVLGLLMRVPAAEITGWIGALSGGAYLGTLVAGVLAVAALVLASMRRKSVVSE